MSCVPVSGLARRFDVVAADVPRLHPGAVDGRQRDAPLADLVLQRPLEHGVEHLRGRGPPPGAAAAAFWKVVKWGTAFRPISRPRSGWSARCAASPR